ncbi:alkaline phosphatase-like [Adelges cooleyi]|uniref:alkaline phosphatase-like n=1 Tax=Adelges cooleyi TaxID=133065 RepID=UPI00217FC8FE|nr:alkaline phosphatase-like [Adelges cooleyi]
MHSSRRFSVVMRCQGVRVLAATATFCVLLAANTQCMDFEHAERNVNRIRARNEAKQLYVNGKENDVNFWSNVGIKKLESMLKVERQYGVAKNVIFFLGDGMSIPTLAAARMYKGQMEGKAGEEDMLTFEKFPFTGLSKTYCVDSQVADSACTATAYLTGVKGNIETIGVSGHVSNRDCVASVVKQNRAESSMRWAQLAGKRTGVVTNMRVTHATPAGAYANVAQRNWECDDDILSDRHKLAGMDCNQTPDIARQLIENETGRNLNVIMGGGTKKFIPENQHDEYSNQGQRKDRRNLMNEWLDLKRDPNSKAKVVQNRSQLLSVDDQTDYLLGLFAPSHMGYNLTANQTVEPTLVEMVEAAIKVLSKGDKGYYLFVEGGLIDWAHHWNCAHLALDETVMLSKAVDKALEMTSQTDTLIVVTADHAHTMSLNGYPYRGSDILGHPSVSDLDDLPYSTLSYANGQGVRPDTGGHRYNLSMEDTNDVYYRFPAMINATWETHGGDDVAVFASGPWSHLFVGNYEQNYIPYAISYASQMGPGAEHTANPNTNAATSTFSFTNLLLIVIVIAIGQLRVNN